MDVTLLWTRSMLSLRKAIYMFWYKDTDNIREKFNNRVASEVVDNLNEVSTVIYDS